ncbi:hypothetical protein PIB30_049946 [Stylosanthes scabra]|uniref:Uncharacterized protein n=1 Tax=Stylosanthes scabra TaxID=79078 RepID=A0ABU6TIJ7_9FABA|nr:hypothetical protein [Stylosanthes scabra]
MHLNNEYHGNLSMTEGIKIQKVYDGTRVRGILTDMKNQDAHNTKARDEILDGDVKDLCMIIRKVLEFPFKEDAAPDISEEVKSLCLTQLMSYSRKDLLTIKWTLDPILFWNVNRRISFLRSIHWMFYRHGTTDQQLVNNSVFVTWSYNRTDPNLTRVYGYTQLGARTNPNKYSQNYSLILFYRNCIEHVDFAHWLKPNDPAVIHELFLKEFDVLLPSIRTIHKLLTLDFTRPANMKIKCFLESVANQIEL